MRGRLWTLLALLTCVSGEYLMGGHLDNNAEPKFRYGKIEGPSALERRTYLDDLGPDLVAEESAVAKTSTDEENYEDGVPRYHIPYPFAFNGGKPFSLEKDPITGKIDFEKAPPIKALNYTSRYQEDEKSDNDPEDRDDDKDGTYAEREKITSKDTNVDVGPNEINTYTANSPNLPVHYSSRKYSGEYPFISSSYASTKVQSGANSYSYNHRPYHSDVPARFTKYPYMPMIKTSTYKTTTVNDFNEKWTTARQSTPAPSATTSVFSTSTKAPIVTTWKPSSIPTAFHSIDRTETEDEKNILPIEKLHASHRHPGSVAMQSPNNGNNEASEKEQTNTRYKDPQPFPDLALSHTKPEMQPPARDDEEYGDLSETYELEDEADNEEGDGEETDYSLSFQELLKENITSSTTTTSGPTTSTRATTTTATTSSSTTTTTATSTTVTEGSSIGTTAAPSVKDQSSRSTSMPPALQKDTFASNSVQFPKIPQHPASSSSFSVDNDRRQSVAEHYDGVISNSHGYRPNWMVKSPVPGGLGTGTVIESTSTIVVPPDQDIVSFVLGNRQNVEGGYYSVGTAIGENPYGSSSDIQMWPLRHEPPNNVKYEHPPATEPSPNRVTQKWLSPTSSALKTNNEVDPVRSQESLVAPTMTIHDTKDNRNKEKNPSSYVVFPGDEMTNKNPLTEEHIVIVNEADGSIRELPPKTIVTTTAANKTKLNLPTTGGDSLPQLAEDLMPPVESSKPPSYYYHQFDTSKPDHLRPQRLPLPPRVKPHPGLPVIPPDAGLRKRPYSPDTKLPNILPQFRPNAKASHGHRGPDVIGTMSAGQGLPPRIRQPLPSHSSSRRPLPPPPPSYLQRLNPPPPPPPLNPPPPIHAIRLPHVPMSKADSVALPHVTEQTIRRFRPPHGGPPISRGSLEENLSNRLFGHGAGQEERNAGSEIERDDDNRKEDRIKSEDERENDSSERYPEEPPVTPPRPPIFPKRKTADHPRVTTLQMIQHHGELDDGASDDEITEVAQPVEPVLAYEPELRRKSDNHDSTEMIAEQPVYVVYPVTTAVNIHSDDSNEKDGSVVVGTLGPQRPLPPDTLLQDERENTRTVYNSRPVVASDFPYPLERPDPSSIFPGVKETPVLVPSDQRQQTSTTTASETAKNEQDAVNVIPYLPYRKKNDVAISVTLHRASPSTTPASSPLTSTATPIAYVYTPTQAAHSARRPDGDDENDDANVDAKQTVLLPSQQPSSSSSSAPAPQNFMAPFVPSLSAETSSKNGWSVVEPPEGAERKQDGDSDDAASSDVETQTEKEFDAENFKPQFFGGFKPIYEFPPGDTEDRDAADTNAELNMPRGAKKLSPVT